MRERFGLAVLSISVIAGFVVTLDAMAQAKPALIRDVDRAAAQPVSGKCVTSFSTASTSYCVLYVVPAGKRLVLQTISYRVGSDPDQLVHEILVGEVTSPQALVLGKNVFSLALPSARPRNGSNFFIGTESITLYVDENNILEGGTQYSVGGAIYGPSFSFSGYLVDK